MRATYVPAPAGPGGVADVVDAERVVVTAPAEAAGGGELEVSLRDRRRLRVALTPAQVRAVLRRWVRAVRAGAGRLQIGD
jgi:hypothetical protein